MREIKFRAWDGKKMWQVDELQLNQDGAVEVCVWVDEGGEDDPTLTKMGCNHKHCNLQELAYNRLWVMQYTGLKDRNGTEIYEGDIILADPKHARKRGKGVVEYDDNVYGAGFVIREISPSFIEYSDPIPDEETYKQRFYDEMGKCFSWNTIEVIGNIHATQ